MNYISREAGADWLRGCPVCACVGGWWRHRSLAPSPSLSFSVESSEARRAVHGISHLYTTITHTLYSLIKRQTNFCVVFIDHRDTCASFLASSLWNKQLVQQQRAWGEYGVHSDLSDFVVWSSQVKV